MKKLIYKFANNDQEMEGIRAVRRQVFVEEQGITEDLVFEGDGRDDEMDVAALEEESVVGTVRVVFLTKDTVKIERMAVLDFSDKHSKQLFISIQMEDSQSGKMTKRTGPVRLESEYYSIKMPNQVFLDAEGFIRFPIEIDPPRMDDPEFNGLIQIRANMDDIGFDDVGEGMMVLRVVNGQRKRSLFIDPKNDRIEKR